MHLDGLLAGAEATTDLFVEQAPHDQLKDLGLAGSEGCGAALEFFALGLIFEGWLRRSQGSLDRLDQLLFGDRLLKEVAGAIAHRLHGHRNVAVAGDEDDRQGNALRESSVCSWSRLFRACARRAPDSREGRAAPARESCSRRGKPPRTSPGRGSGASVTCAPRRRHRRRKRFLLCSGSNASPETRAAALLSIDSRGRGRAPPRSVSVYDQGPMQGG